MAQMMIISLLFLSLTILGFLGTVESRSSARTYLETQCQPTLYADLCVRTLLPYAEKNELPSPQKIAQISLTTCLDKARFLKTYVDKLAKEYYYNKMKNPEEHQNLAECLQQIKNRVNQITQSVKKLQKMGHDGEENFARQSWVRAAQTDTTICIDGFSENEFGSKAKSMIKERFLNVKQLASNCLVLLN
uniref:pectinesterase inhibitor 9-like n=1 Tax=Erigeron canadensis TaxID=72917 RepID=UPI001CB98158|nr:pectinesterase inhibitor 9-like [Erigeron canadensis]